MQLECHYIEPLSHLMLVGGGYGGHLPTRFCVASCRDTYTIHRSGHRTREIGIRTFSFRGSVCAVYTHSIVHRALLFLLFELYHTKERHGDR